MTMLAPATDLAARLPADQRLRGASPTGTSSRPASRRQGAPTGSETTPAEQERADRRRFPLQPALDYMARHGVSGNTIRQAGVNFPRALRIGSVNGDQADRLAGILRLHPYELWGDAWYDFDDEPPCQHNTDSPSTSSTREIAGQRPQLRLHPPGAVTADAHPGSVLWQAIHPQARP